MGTQKEIIPVLFFGLAWFALGCSTPTTGHFAYVFPDGEIDVFDIDNGHRRVKTMAVPEATIIRGVAAHAADHLLYIAGLGLVVVRSWLAPMRFSIHNRSRQFQRYPFHRKGFGCNSP